MKPLYVALCILFFAACDRPDCTNSNPVFDQYAPDAPEYKAELARELAIADTNNLRYWVKEYVEDGDDGDDSYISVFVQNEKLCAIMMLHLTQWNKLGQLKAVKGKGYSGAELAGLRYTIKKDSSSTDFIYEDVDAIVD
jgi:hypothetical protein